MKEMGTIKPLEKGIGNRGFISLLLTMACGALNDNLYRGTLMLLVVSGSAWGGSLGSGGTGWVTLMVYVPFLLLLGRIRKQNLLAQTRCRKRVMVSQTSGQ